MSEYKLAIEIIRLSENPVWDVAKTEWKLLEIEDSEEDQTCLCGHFPIRELCILENKLNAKTAVVGNCCVNKFLGLPSNKIFAAIKRIKKDTERSLNEATIELANERGWISDWERTFYVDIMRKRRLTEKQQAKKLQVNVKVLKHLRKGG